MLHFEAVSGAAGPPATVPPQEGSSQGRGGGADETSLVGVASLHPDVVHVCGVHGVAFHATSSVTSQRDHAALWALGPVGSFHSEEIKTSRSFF